MQDPLSRVWHRYLANLDEDELDEFELTEQEGEMWIELAAAKLPGDGLPFASGAETMLGVLADVLAETRGIDGLPN